MEITNNAKEYLHELMRANAVSTIRIVVSGIGWGGPQLGLALAEAEEADIVETINGIQVAMEKSIATDLAHVTLDLKEDASGKSIAILGASSC